MTLGGTSLKREKRHPTLGDNVVVGAGAKIIGGFTIGAGSRIGAGSVVVREVPQNSVVVGVPGRITFRDGERVTAASISTRPTCPIRSRGRSSRCSIASTPSRPRSSG